MEQKSGLRLRRFLRSDGPRRAGGRKFSAKWPMGLPKRATVGGMERRRRLHTLGTGRQPEYLMFFLPKRDYQVMDDWYTVGLRGSASASIEAHEALVPRHRVFRLAKAMETGEAPGLAYNRGAIYRVPIMTGLGIAPVPPSVRGAQGVAERFRKAAGARAPLFQQRQTELVFSQSVLAESMVTLEALEQMLYRYADELTNIAHEQQTVDRATRTKLFAWRAYIGAPRARSRRQPGGSCRSTVHFRQRSAPALLA
jgi:alkylation response protein AidB-like acyl-CoA dehydrogenase